MKERMSDLPMPMREWFAETVDLTDKFCVQHLNNEYRGICRKLAIAVCRAGAPVALPFAINLVANLIFTPIQFGMRNLTLASVDILIVWGAIIRMSIVPST